ncbi:MAG: polyphenol oxidase family protein, partial [Candidatus Omnitrophica bacterium]|nr:polyphenol oxidase family protein [Candidatus Omnitrophota bacterium]
MKLIEHIHSYYCAGVFPQSITGGFTKTNLEGDPCRDLPGALALPGGYRIAYLEQIHTDIIHTVKAEGLYRGDGLFTDVPGIVLTVKTADCMPLLVYHARSGTVGVIHMGWRSAEVGILENIPVDLADCAVVAGVGMRKCCYKVGREFLTYRRLRPFLSPELHFDPVEYSRRILTGRGLRPVSFYDTGIC